MHADVDERAEVGHVRDHAFELHAGHEIAQLLHAVLERGALELGTRVAARLVELRENVFHRRHAELRVGEVLGRERLQHRRLADQVANRQPRAGDDPFHHRIRLGMHGRGIERVVAVHHAQEASGLLERALAHARHLQQLLAAAEGTVGVAERHDVAGQRVAQARDTRQQRHRRGIQIRADGVHAVFHHRIERLAELQRTHVMLILAHADGLGIDPHELRERILQTARNRHGPAQRHVEIGELLGGERGRRIHRGAGFRHHHLGERQVGQRFDQVGRERVGFARRGAVADGDELHAVPGGELSERAQGARPVLARLVRVDRGRVEHLAGAVHDRHLHPGANARVEAHRHALTRRRRQQQVVQVAAEHADRLELGLFAQARLGLDLEVQQHLHLPREAHRVEQPRVGGPALVGDAHPRGDAALGLARPGHAVVGQAHRQPQHAFLAAA